MKKGRYTEAYSSLQKLRWSELQAARDIFMIHAQLEAEKEIFTTNGNTLKRFIELFTIPRIRRANLASGTVMLAQQMCGSTY